MTLAQFEIGWTSTPRTQLVWITIGFIAQFSGSRPRRDGQALFGRRSGISLFGGLLVYAVDRVDPAFIVGQAAGFVIYARNIHFIWLGRRAPSPANVA